MNDDCGKMKENRGGRMMEISKIRKEVEAQIGKTVYTVYGESLVVGIIEDANGVEYIELKEFGEEEFYVKIEEWTTLLQ